MAAHARIIGPLALAVLSLLSLSGTDAGGLSWKEGGDVVVAGLIPAPVDAALATATGSRVRNVPQAGSLGIVGAMRQGQVAFGAITSDAAYLAFTGRLNGGTAPFEELRGITVLELKTIHLMVRKHLRIGTIADLGGANVSLGPPGTGTSIVSELLLNAHGLTRTDISAEYVPVPEAVQRLAAGTLDAAFMPLVAPSADATLAARSGAQLLEIAGPKVEELRLQHPFLLRSRLPEHSYPGQTKLVPTIAVDLLLVCRAEMDESIVYDFLHSYFTALAKTTAVTDLSRATGMPIPLHAGAARYYRERELSR